MNLRHISIENFRGVTNLGLEIGNTAVLIGENNTGKTAVLDGLRFALRDVRSRRGCAFDEYDFHLSDTSAEPTGAPPINIRLIFREDEPNQWPEQQVARLNRAGIAQSDADGRISVIFKVSACFNPDEQDYLQDWEFQNLEGNALSVHDSAISILQSEVSYYYLAALRDAAKHFGAKGTFWRPFLKESQLSPEMRAEIEDRLSEVNDLIISSHGSFDQVIERLREVQHVISMGNGEDIVSVEAVPARLFDTLSKAQVNLNSDTGAKIPVGRHGEGTQSLAVLTLFNAFLQVWSRGAPIVALEEPESHLHPSAIRALWQLIERIPGQKIISTHSGDLLSEVPFESIIRLYHQSGIITARRMIDIPLDSTQRRQFNYHIRQARGELLFAKCWILGEGETEVTLIPEVARILDKYLERCGIRCIGYRHSNIGLFIKVADSMGIHWIALTDNDYQGIKDQEEVRDSLNGRDENEVLFTVPEEDIEQYLCVSGFSDVYESFLTSQSLAKITVSKDNPQYPKQLTKAVHRHKIAAVNKIVGEIQNGRSIPPLFEQVIDAAIRRANSQ
ncbi:MAG: DUF2813 domain-containing protein [Methanoregulaceae archaeon]|nr:DUF2813 domain-containing protein [Methanoregulaceae archaeon]